MTKKIKNSNFSSEISKAIKKPDGQYFFGYYDVCPWNKEGSYLLAHKSDFIDRPPNAEDSIEVGFVNLSNRKFISVDKTSAWNFQQGSRLQWLPNSSNKFIYNSRDNSEFKSFIFDIENKNKEELNHSIYSLSPKENFALSINYSRLERLGGYGYKRSEDKFKDNPAPERDGIFKIDLEDNKKNLLISINEVAKFKNPSFNKINSHHYLLFPTFNQKGDRFCFLHRFKLDDGGIYTRLLTANSYGSDLRLITEGTLSHFDWFNNKKILIWGRTRSYLTKARKYKFFNLPVFKPILNLLRNQIRGFVRHKVIGDQYMLFEDRSGKKVKSLGVGKLNEDGHPTRFKDSPWLITDTYPDDNHYRTLILYNIEYDKKIDLGKFYSIPDKKYLADYNKDKDNWDLSSMRSDLHPRWNRSGDKVCFDSVHDGTKQIYITNLEKIIN